MNVAHSCNVSTFSASEEPDTNSRGKNILWEFNVTGNDNTYLTLHVKCPILVKFLCSRDILIAQYQLPLKSRLNVARHNKIDFVFNITSQIFLSDFNLIGFSGQIFMKGTFHYIQLNTICSN
jgi:hypothetical protein